jgi:hypothetical protein
MLLAHAISDALRLGIVGDGDDSGDHWSDFAKSTLALSLEN